MEKVVVVDFKILVFIKDDKEKMVVISMIKVDVIVAVGVERNVNKEDELGKADGKVLSNVEVILKNNILLVEKDVVVENIVIFEIVEVLFIFKEVYDDVDCKVLVVSVVHVQVQVKEEVINFVGIIEKIKKNINIRVKGENFEITLFENSKEHVEEDVIIKIVNTQKSIYGG